jgi:YfiH family protein
MADVALLRSSLLAAVPGVVHGFSTRAGGVSEGRLASLNLGGSRGDDTASVRENRRRLAAAFGRPVDALALGEQRHGSDIAAIGADDGARLPTGGRGFRGVDAVMTDEPGPLLAVLSADCVPILLASHDGGAVAAVHSGWRGTAAGVLRNTVRSMSETYGVQPDRMVAAIGPAIGPCCYEVDGPVIEAFGAANAALSPGRPGHAMLDLQAANRAQLIEEGVDPVRIDALDYCTSCRTDLFYSARREGEPTGRFAGAITIDR